MPIYEYRCGSCNHETEALQKLSDAPLRDCPECGQPAMIKKISAAGFQLKGTGWYATDFKGSGSKPAKADSKPEGKAETKTEAKTETASADAAPACGAGACSACS